MLRRAVYHKVTVTAVESWTKSGREAVRRIADCIGLHNTPPPGLYAIPAVHWPPHAGRYPHGPSSAYVLCNCSPALAPVALAFSNNSMPNRCR